MEKLLVPEKLTIDPDLEDSTERWTHWKQRLNNYLSLQTDATDQSKLFLLINLISTKLFRLIKDCDTFDAAIKKLESTFVRQTNILFARFQLHTCRQDPSITIEKYLHQLEHLADACEFKAVDATENRKDHISDTFIQGLHSSYIRQRLLESQKTDLNDLLSIAKSLEAAHSQAAAFPSGEQTLACTTAVDSPHTRSIDTTIVDSEIAAARKTSSNVETHENRCCFFCGRPFHHRNKCPARDATCHSCGKTGHFASVCRSSKCRKQPSSYSAALCSTNRSSNSTSKTVKTITINDHSIRTLLDTGSSDNFIDAKVANSLRLRKTNCHKQVQLASSSRVERIHHQCITNIGFMGRSFSNIKFFVLPNLCTPAILGREFLQSMDYVTFKFGGEEPGITVAAIESSNSMYVKPLTLFPSLQQNLRPVATKSRRQTVDNSKFIQNEIESLLQQSIIEESRSPWRAQVLVVSRPNKKPRMVVDYSCTINKFTILDAYPLPKIDELISQISHNFVFTTVDLSKAYYQIPLLEEDKPYTAFEACGQLYQFRRIPFGLTNAVSVFQRLMNRIISENNLEGVYAYLDDIIICGKSEEEHDRRFAQFIEVANRINLKISHEKTRYRKHDLNFLGYRIQQGTLKPDPSRIRPLIDYPMPDNKRSMQRFLGLLAYYAKWIKNFSTKIQPLLQYDFCSRSNDVKDTFQSLKREIADASLAAYVPGLPLCVETDASYSAIGAVLTQNNNPVAFFSQTLPKTSLRQPIVEKEAQAIVSSIKYWRHYLLGYHFKIITDQRSVNYMFARHHTNRIKNDKVARWRLELAPYNYDIEYRPGKINTIADAMSRMTCARTLSRSYSELQRIHSSLCHPGITRMMHYVKEHELPYEKVDISKVIDQCTICAELKPRFYKPNSAHLITATQVFERLNIDFKGPLQSSTRNKYLLCIVDEFSRFPFAIPCPDCSSRSVISALNPLFSIFGNPAKIHSDQGTCFTSREFQNYLSSLGIAYSHSTPYNPRGNGQAERYVGVIWKAIQLKLKTESKSLQQWESVIPQALSSIRALLCTATRYTPHERMFHHNRNSKNHRILPPWLKNGDTVLLRDDSLRGNQTFRPFNSLEQMVITLQLQTLTADPLTFQRVKLPNIPRRRNLQTNMANRHPEILKQH